MSYARSFVPGAGTHFPTQHVRLPLKYPKRTPPPSVNDRFVSLVAASGKLVALRDTFLDLVAVQVLNDLHRVVFVPIKLESSLALKLQTIDLELPHKLSASGNVSVHVDTEGSDPLLVVDLIDVNHLFITVTLRLDDFLRSSRLALDNFSAWGLVSVPYSFELRSAPYLVRSVSSTDVFVSLKDGGLLHFQRAHPLAPFDVFNFTTASLLIPFFRTKDTVHNDISSNAVVDVVAVSDSLIVTLSVSKTLKLWDFSTHTQVSSVDVDTSAAWLTPVPTRYLHLYQHDNNQYLVVHYLTTSEDGAKFATFDVQKTLVRVDRLTFVPETTAEKWLVQDFEVVASNDVVSYHVLWKSNTSSKIHHYTFDFTGQLRLVRQLVTPPPSQDLLSHHDIGFYQSRILALGDYDHLTVYTAVNTLREYAGLEPATSSRPLLAVINETLDHSVDKRNAWYKLLILCEEYRKSSEEVLAIGGNVVLHVNGVSVVRDAHVYEKFFEETSPLSTLLQSVAKRMSTKTYSRLSHAIAPAQVDANTATHLFHTLLSHKFSDAEIADITAQLQAIPDATGQLEVLLENPAAAHDGEAGVKTTLGLLVAVSTFKEIKRQHETLLLNVLVLLLVCEVNNAILDYINKFVAKLALYRVFDTVLGTVFKSADPRAPVDSSNLVKVEYSLVWSLFERSVSVGSLIRSGEYNAAYDGFFVDFSTHYDDYLVAIITELINHGEGKLIKHHFFHSLGARDIDTFLIGLVHLINDEPTEFFDIFKDYAVFEKINTVQVKAQLLLSLTTTESIHNFLQAIFVDDADEVVYYHALAELLRSRHPVKFLANAITAGAETEFLEKSLEFERIAISKLRENDPRIHTFYATVFDVALSLSNHDLVYEALSNLEGSPNFKGLFSRYIKHLASNKIIAEIFPPHRNELFRHNYLVIDTILLELANGELLLLGLLRYYEYLYSWRLFGASSGLAANDIVDKRGAIEALYLFVTRFKFEQKNLLTTGEAEDIRQYNLKILEVYIIIINALRSFSSDDDRWLVSHRDNGDTAITKLDDVTLEYYDWLKLLERDID